MTPAPHVDLRISEIPWIDAVPHHWEQTQFRAVFSQKRVKNTGMLEDHLLSLSYGRIVPRDIGSSDGLIPESYETYQIVDPDDIIFRFTDLQNDKRSLRSARVTERGIITSAYVAAQPVNIEARYAEYLMRSYDTSKVFYGLGGGVRQTLKFSDVALLPVLLPPLPEQQAISDYLDRETQRIDDLVAEQRHLIGTLRERKIAFAEQLFGTRVGGHSRLRWSLMDVDERAGNLATELPLFSVSIDWGVRRRRMGDSKQAEGDLTKYKVARRGDVVLNRMRAFQGALGVAPEDGVVSPDYSVIRTTADVDSAWLASVMRAPAFIGEMVSRIRGIGGVESGVVRTPRLNFVDLREICVILPDINQQRVEANMALDQTSRIDALISESEDLIALSQERRAALITAAVTGQIDVRTAV